ncbi:glycosyltransferase family 2 protein [bacterium]|nr:glycosyltransferase family 2 protein [bacterium]
MNEILRRFKYWLKLKYRVALGRGWGGRGWERVWVGLVRPTGNRAFWVVSSQRNAGRDVVRCLDSVYGQDYDRDRVRHVMIDDASTDETPRIIEDWLAGHPGHSVEYIHQTERQGGCSNNLLGFRMSGPSSIVLELNADDWLPDPGVLDYLNRVYEDSGTWMTYNTMILSDGFIPKPAPIPRKVLEAGNIRETKYFGPHLHSFRRELLAHVPEEKLIDPATGKYFASADDQAFYLTLFELCGNHARHLYRMTYVYNFKGYAEDYGKRSEQEERVKRIRSLPKALPLRDLGKDAS